MKMIVCVSENYGIGKENGLLFSLPPDMKLFRETTMGKVIIMGRATLDSFPNGAPLKNRVNIVLTHDKSFARENVLAFNSVEDILSHIKNYPESDCYVIGGAEIYRLFEPYCNEAIVTKVRKTADADKFFFNIDESDAWEKYYESEKMNHEGIEFTFCRYKRILN